MRAPRREKWFRGEVGELPTNTQPTYTPPIGSGRRVHAWTLYVAWHEDPALLGTKAVLPLAGMVKVGRRHDPFSPAALQDQNISREHLMLEIEPDKVTLTSVGRAGTFVNGDAKTQAALGDGDVLSLGRTLLVLRKTYVHEEIVPHEALIGCGAHAAAIAEAVGVAAASDVSVCVQGETGTGKKNVIRVIHALSLRSAGPILVLSFRQPERPSVPNLGASVGGAWLLDGAEEMTPGEQDLWGRVLQDKVFAGAGSFMSPMSSIRVFATSRVPLAERVDQGMFSGHLFCRLTQQTIGAAPLRERKEDIPLLALGGVQRSGAPEMKLSRSLAFALLCHRWEGNIAELQRVIHLARESARVARRSTLCLTPVLEEALSGKRLSPAPIPRPRTMALVFAPADRDLGISLEKHLQPCLGTCGVQLRSFVLAEQRTAWSGMWDRIRGADIVLVLVGPDLLASRHWPECAGARNGVTSWEPPGRLVPVLARPVDLASDTGLARLRALPRNGVPIRGWADQDAAMVDVVEGVKRILRNEPIADIAA